MIELARQHLRARRLTEALRYFAECEFDESSGDIWRCHMFAGEFESAWRTADEIERRSPSRVWNGEDFKNKRVLIRCVHGLGDTIQFIRYARELKLAGARSVAAQVHPELVGIISTASDLDECITWGPRPPFDTEIEVMELPWAFRTTLSNLRAQTPYLYPPAEIVSRRRSRFSQTEQLRVGLVWTSSAWDETRSAPLSLLERWISKIAGIDFYSLQHGPKHVDASDHPWLGYSGEQSADILHTAADLVNIDLLITVDTMIAHLAGALGQPVWVLLKHDADWRWLIDRCDSPWYPTMRLFRQPRPGDWETPVRAMVTALGEFSRNRYRAASSQTPDLLSPF